MSTYTYYEVLTKVLDQIQHLPPDEQLQLVKGLAAIIRQRVPEKPLHSVLEFEGVGEGVWEGMDAQEFVNQERDSWDG